MADRKTTRPKKNNTALQKTTRPLNVYIMFQGSSFYQKYTAMADRETSRPKINYTALKTTRSLNVYIMMQGSSYYQKYTAMTDRKTTGPEINYTALKKNYTALKCVYKDARIFILSKKHVYG